MNLNFEFRKQSLIKVCCNRSTYRGCSYELISRPWRSYQWVVATEIEAQRKRPLYLGLRMKVAGGI